MAAPLLLAGIAAGAGLGSAGINAMAQGKINKRTMRYNREMYNLQRQHSLQDWAMQNEYNSPAAQMARLKAAGLNPNLVYDNGANMSAAQSVQKSEVQGWNPRAPQYDISGAAQSAIQVYQQAEMQQAQVDNLKAQNSVLIQDQLLRAAQVLNTSSDTAIKRFDLQFKSDIRETSMEAVRESLRKLQADTKFTLDQNERAAAMQAPNLAIAAQTVLKMRAETAKTAAERKQIYAQIESIRRDIRIKDLDIALKEKGIQPNDPIYMRMLARLLDSGSQDYKESPIGGHDKSNVDSIRTRLERFRFRK